MKSAGTYELQAARVLIAPQPLLQRYLKARSVEALYQSKIHI